jgi:hypothetical protein
MTTYTYDPAGIHLPRLQGEASLLGGEAVRIARPRLDGTPGVEQLEVSVPDATPFASVEAAVAAATGCTDEQFAAWLLALSKSEAEDLVVKVDLHGRALRAVVLTALDEVNVLRDWVTQFKAATAAATSLANFQTRVAALPNLPQRTAAQAKSALLARINTADAD